MIGVVVAYVDCDAGGAIAQSVLRNLLQPCVANSFRLIKGFANSSRAGGLCEN